MRQWFVAALVLMMLPGGLARADDADDQQRLAVSEQVLQLTTTEASVAARLDAIWPVILKGVMAHSTGTPPTDAQLATLHGQFTDLIKQVLDDSRADYAALYAKEFTLDELNAFLAFYSSPAGKKWLALQPDISKQSMAIVMSKMQARLPDFERQVQQAFP